MFNNDEALRRIEEAKINNTSGLNLSGLYLTSVPEALVSLTSLRSLLLCSNRLSSIPVWLGHLTSLQELNLGANCLTSLPESLGFLKSLQELYLQNNCLTSLPESLGSLGSLQKLHLALNRLTSLPESLNCLAAAGNLRVLYLHDNPGLGLTKVALGPAWNEVSPSNPPKPPKKNLEAYFSARVFDRRQPK